MPRTKFDPDIEYLLLLPDPEFHGDPEPLPHGLQTGYYSRSELVQLLRDYKDNPDAILFIADMLE